VLGRENNVAVHIQQRLCLIQHQVEWEKSLLFSVSEHAPNPGDHKTPKQDDNSTPGNAYALLSAFKEGTVSP